jgi:hypothetical protein
MAARKRSSTPSLVAPTTDPLAPSAAVIVKLGSIAVHAAEMLSPRGHAFDKMALDQLLSDPEIVAWRASASALGLLPVPRR